ncbi:MAG: MgtC/SapB family protein [Candidatus Spechtbacteria bacterium]|nr:MgtC/SapB family protein [Candidatus Spechtbacteria bacterium]
MLGSILGAQREYTGKAAGLRTYSLVAVGACLFTVISRGGFNEFLVDASRYDPSRIASNVVVGIGFLGAGVIILRGVRIEGLTTAAGLWVSAGIGMAVGVEMYGVAIFTTVLVFGILEVLGKFDIEEWLLHSRRRL